MKLSNKWFPGNLQDRAAWFANFLVMIQSLGAGLGFSPAEIAALVDDATAFANFAAGRIVVDTYTERFGAYWKTLTEGEVGDVAPEWPGSATPGQGPDVLPGIFERVNAAVNRIRASANYSPETGEAFRIIPTQSDEVPENDMKPALKATTLPGSLIEIAFVRGKTDGIEVEIVVDGQGGWVKSGRFVASPAEVTIADGSGPHSVEIRARYLEKNTAVGQNSDVVTVVTTP